MILKIKTGTEDWTFIDSIKSLKVYKPENFGLVVEKNDTDIPVGDLIVRVRGLSENMTLDRKRRVNKNSLYAIDEFAFDAEEIISQYDENDDDKYWGVIILFVIFNDESNKTIACYSWNEDIYLLNNEGKTIERL